ncbi:MAG: hypothetical protein GX542_06075 [Rhodococcus sp.]|nr:hypothetical protein [Rhodococcus sp. (in: high G+C Gram-positive bacteria)]
MTTEAGVSGRSSLLHALSARTTLAAARLPIRVFRNIPPPASQDSIALTNHPRHSPPEAGFGRQLLTADYADVLGQGIVNIRSAGLPQQLTNRDRRLLRELTAERESLCGPLSDAAPPAPPHADPVAHNPKKEEDPSATRRRAPHVNPSPR